MIEFALVSILFFTFLLATVDFGRMLYTYSAANEATRLAARYAVVCHDSSTAIDAQVLTLVQRVVPQVSQVSVEWTPPACSVSNCEGVAVAIENFQFNWLTPLVGTIVRPSWVMPRMSTYLPREVMRQDPNSNVTLCPLP
ncbi:TadE family protein [Ramlibacter rhizophilus]|nr:TadE family protein [Ramlibacter rhizophilus]